MALLVLGSRTLDQVNVTNPSKPPLEFGFMLNSTHTYQKKCKKVPGTGLGLDLQVYYYESPYNQGQLTEVPLNFKLIAIKVVGQTIQVCSTTKMSKLQQNGIIKLGLINFFVLYCNFTLKKCKCPNLGWLLAFKSVFFALTQTRLTI